MPSLLGEWNNILPVGTRVRYYSVLGQPEFFESKTRSAVWSISGRLLVMIEGKAGGVDVHHLEVLHT